MSAETGPRVSVGLPVYNGERFVGQAVESVLAQTFAEFELIISDNGSRDATEEICRSYAAQDPRIRYVRSKTNRGAAWNFDRVFELAAGEYFKWVAADDVCGPEFLARCVEALDSNPRAVLAYGRAKAIDLRGQIFLEEEPDWRMDWRSAPVDRFRQLIDRSPWQVLFVFALTRSAALRSTGLIRGYSGSDCNLVAELILQGEFHEVPADLHFFRIHRGSSTWPGGGIAKTQQFYDPSVRSRLAIMLSRRRRYFQYFVSIIRSRLSAFEKAQLLAYNAGRAAPWFMKALAR